MLLMPVKSFTSAILKDIPREISWGPVLTQCEDGKDWLNKSWNLLSNTERGWCIFCQRNCWNCDFTTVRNRIFTHKELITMTNVVITLSTMNIFIYTVSQKKNWTLFIWAYLSQILSDFNNSFTVSDRNYPPTNM